MLTCAGNLEAAIWVELFLTGHWDQLQEAHILRAHGQVQVWAWPVSLGSSPGYASAWLCGPPCPTPVQGRPYLFGRWLRDPLGLCVRMGSWAQA